MISLQKCTSYCLFNIVGEMHIFNNEFEYVLANKACGICTAMTIEYLHFGEEQITALKFSPYKVLATLK